MVEGGSGTGVLVGGREGVKQVAWRGGTGKQEAARTG